MVEGTVLRILLVEDDDADADIVESSLARFEAEGLSFEMTRAASMEEALAAEGPFDAVLLDLELPDSPASQTMSAIRSWPNSAVIVWTGLDDPDWMQSCLEMGALEYAVKNESDPQLLPRRLFLALIRYAARRPRAVTTELVHLLERHLTTVL